MTRTRCSYQYLVIADDLTGANDTGQQFATAGLDTVVLPSHSTRRPDADVLVVNTDSRTSESRTAAADVRSAVSTASAKIYKKVDSTLRGNLLAEVDAALSASSASIALVAPAFPASGRITVGGYHLVDGTPVSEASAVQTRENPPREADLTALFAGSEYPVSHASVETIAKGPDTLTARLRAVQERHEGLVVCDAATEDHLRTVADAGRRLTETPLYVGSAGLAGALELTESTTSPDSETATRSVLGVVGSTNQRTFDQLRRVPDEIIVTLDVERAVADPAAAGDALAADVSNRLRPEGSVVVTSAQSTADVTAALEHGRTHGIESEAVRSNVARALTTAIDSLWTDCPTDAVFASGGTVAGTVFETLGIDAIELGSTAVEQAVPLATATTRDDRRVTLATKAGGFGSDDAIVNCLSALGADIDPNGP